MTITALTMGYIWGVVVRQFEVSLATNLAVFAAIGAILLVAE